MGQACVEETHFQQICKVSPPTNDWQSRHTKQNTIQLEKHFPLWRGAGHKRGTSPPPKARAGGTGSTATSPRSRVARCFQRSLRRNASTRDLKRESESGHDHRQQPCLLCTDLRDKVMQNVSRLKMTERGGRGVTLLPASGGKRLPRDLVGASNSSTLRYTRESARYQRLAASQRARNMGKRGDVRADTALGHRLTVRDSVRAWTAWRTVPVKFPSRGIFLAELLSYGVAVREK